MTLKSNQKRNQKVPVATAVLPCFESAVIVPIGGRTVAVAQGRTRAIALSVAASAAATLMQGGVAFAANINWNAAGSGTWNTTNTNWNTATTTPWDSSNGPTNIAVFNTPSTPTITLTATNPTANGIIFTQSATVTGGTLTLAGSTPTITANANSTISSVIAGTSGLVSNGSANLVLSGINTYTGGTTISSGILQTGNASALGAQNSAASNVTVASGATLDINGAASNSSSAYGYGVTIAGSGTSGQGALINNGLNGSSINVQTPNITLAANATIGGSGNIYMIAGGFGADTLTLGNNTLTKIGGNTFFLCNTTVTAGTVSVLGGVFSQATTASNASAADFSLANTSGVSLSLNNLNLSIGSLTGGGATGGNVNLGTATLTVGGTNASPAAYAGVISGSGGRLTKVGTGTLILSGANTYSGGTTISAGILQTANASALGAQNSTASNVTVASGATLDINGAASNSSFAYGYGVTIAGSGTSGQGALINNGASGSSNNVQTPNITLAANATIGGSGNIYMIAGSFGADTLTLGNNTLTKIGGNTFFLCNTTVTAGTVSVLGGVFSQATTASNASAADFSLANTSGVSLSLNNLNLSIGSLTGGGATGGNVNLGTATLTVGGTNASPAAYAGVISGSGGRLTKVGTGTLILSGANTYSGGTTVNTGTVVGSSSATASGGNAASFGSGDIVVNGGVVADGADRAVLGGAGLTRTLTLNGGTWDFSTATSGGEYGYIINMTGGTIVTTLSGGYFRSSTAGLTINSFASLSSSMINSGIDATYSNLVFNVASGASNGQDLVITGKLSENSGAGSGSKTVTKNGAGVLVLTGSSSYTGATNISNGTLAINGTGTINSTSSVVINGGEFAYNSSTALTKGITFTNGKLSGTGSVTAVTAGSGDTVAPGSSSAANTYGTLTVNGAFSLSGGGKLAIDLAKTNTGGTVVVDRLAVTTGNTVTVGGGALVLTLGNFVEVGDTFYIVDNQGSSAIGGVFSDTNSTINGSAATFAGSGTSYTLSGGGYQFLVNYAATAPGSSSGNDISLQTTVTPEPTTMGLIGLGAMGLLSRRRRRATTVTA